MVKGTRQTYATTFWGETIEVVLPEPVSAMIYRFGYYDESVCRFLIEMLRPGDTFFDIGAHFGFFSLLARQVIGPNGRVASFEPMPRTRARLMRNLGSNAPTDNFRVLDIAAFDKDCELVFHDHGEARSSFNSAFAARGLDCAWEPVPVRARPIDDVFPELGLERLDVMKIDAESAELNVLEGAVATIETFRPVVIAEFGDFDVVGVPPSRGIADWLVSRNYTPYEVKDAQIVRHGLREHYGYTNLMFIPQERSELLDVRYAD